MIFHPHFRFAIVFPTVCISTPTGVCRFVIYALETFFALVKVVGKEGNRTVFTLSNPVSSDMKQTLCFQILTMAVFNEHSVLLEVSMLPTC